MHSSLANPDENKIVSESRVIPNLAKAASCGFDPNLFKRGGFRFTTQQFNGAVESWRNTIARQAIRIAKIASGNLENLPSPALYDQLDQPSWKKAALAAEIFRNPNVSKNAGWLDTRMLQRHFHEALNSYESIELEVAWGHMKREAGGLKTFGFSADLAEIIALGRLEIIRRAVSKLLGDQLPVNLRVLDGGRRFQSALFADPEQMQAYNEQRRKMAALLSPSGELNVTDFIGELASAVIAEREQKIARERSLINDSQIAQQFNVILLNVDWQRLFSQKFIEGSELPFGISVPEVLKDWLFTNDEEHRRALIRNSIMSIVADTVSPHDEQDVDGEIVGHAFDYMRSVTWEAARIYLAIQRVEKSLLLRQKGNLIKLTVHQKRERRDIPAILTLGHLGGNQLSQHVVTLLTASARPVFGPLAELATRRDISPAWVSNPLDTAEEVLSSLYHDQPFFLFENAVDPFEALCGILETDW